MPGMRILCVLDDVLASAAKLLRVGGRFAGASPDRMMDIIGMRQHRLEPKRIRMVHSQIHKPPALVLVEGCFMVSLT